MSNGYAIGVYRLPFTQSPSCLAGVEACPERIFESKGGLSSTFSVPLTLSVVRGVEGYSEPEGDYPASFLRNLRLRAIDHVTLRSFLIGANKFRAPA